MVFTCRGTLRGACVHKQKESGKEIQTQQNEQHARLLTLLQCLNQSPSSRSHLQTGIPPVVPVLPGSDTPVRWAAAAAPAASSQSVSSRTQTGNWDMMVPSAQSLWVSGSDRSDPTAVGAHNKHTPTHRRREMERSQTRSWRKRLLLLPSGTVGVYVKVPKMYIY